MSVQRYNVNPNGFLVECSQTGRLVRIDDHREEVALLQKIIDEQNVTIKNLKPNKLGFYLVQRWYDRSSVPERDVKRFDELQGFLDYLAKDSSIVNITVCALQPIKVTRKQVLTVEL